MQDSRPTARGSAAAVIARLQTHYRMKLCKMPLRTHAEGGQVQALFGGFLIYQIDNVKDPIIPL